MSADTPRRRALRAGVLAAYRVRSFGYALVIVPLVAIAVTSLFPWGDDWQAARRAIGWAAIGLGAITVSIGVVGARILPTREPVTVTSPVQGRWLALNSPASQVPSHGVRAYGQSHAIDLVAEPADRHRPAFGDGPLMRAASAYPALGEPVTAMISGRVVRASGWRRDHRARSHGVSLGYLMAEGAVRELGGPGFVVGNHVTIRGDDGTFALVAHLQRGSLRVRVGNTVTAGQQIAACGNSGNSSEPHVHAQLMDRASLWTAQGIPMAFAGITLGEDPAPVTGLPENEQHMVASGGCDG